MGFSALLRAGWPGWLSVGICGFWLVFWAGLAPRVPTTAPPARTTAPLVKPRDISVVTSVAKLRELFAEIDYDLEAVRAGTRPVPRLFLAAVPEGLSGIGHPAERKQVFIAMMLPLVLEANARVRSQRDWLLALASRRAKGKVPAAADGARLEALFREYRVRSKRLDVLLARVDEVPSSIALAQSAIESGWGTSRFTREGNAPFGQWTSATYKGLVPRERPEGKTYKVRTFSHLLDAAQSYIQNINTHGAYLEFRRRRRAMRAAGKPLDSMKLIGALSAYAEDGEDYVRLIQSVIVRNRLGQLDSAKLRPVGQGSRPDV
jgi:Bax protein